VARRRRRPAARRRLGVAAWRRTSGSVADLPAHLDVVAGLLERQVSPEIPLALAAISELRALVEDAADQLLALAGACDDYATAVEDTRERTGALLTEIGQMVIEEVALTVVVAGLTGGFGGGAKALAALARIRAQAPRFHALLVSLRVVVASAGTRLRAARTELVDVRRALQPLCRVRPHPAHFGPRSLGAAHRPRFEGSPKHRSRTIGRASKAPRDGQETLDVSLPVSPATTTRRVGYDDVREEFVVFDETTAGVFHGHVRDWADLTPAMRRVLRSAGIVDRRGRPIGEVE
jgi:hypothetical protein